MKKTPQQKTPTGEGSTSSTCTVNLVLFVLCISSMGSSFYANFRQSILEDRLHYMNHLDDRLTVVEAKLQNIQSTGGSFVEPPFTDVASVVRKLSLEVAGIQRLRRDVSHLKVTRQQRQTAIQQTPDCVCPPGPPGTPVI
ncbi:Collagen alpha chain CG42342 [Sergentomyia squamirostris]